jgi:hypothetical protein
MGRWFELIVDPQLGERHRKRRGRAFLEGAFPEFPRQLRQQLLAGLLGGLGTLLEDTQISRMSPDRSTLWSSRAGTSRDLPMFRRLVRAYFLAKAGQPSGASIGRNTLSPGRFAITLVQSYSPFDSAGVFTCSR